MIESPGLLFSILAFLLLIGPLVFIHEMGHYLVGRWFGVKAEVFSIGFGRELVGWTDRRGTRWKIAPIPMGGYVRFAGDMNPASQPTPEWLALPPAQRAQTFQAKPLWQRALIVAAGPAINFLAAIVILAGFAVAYGDFRTPPVAQAVVAGSAAAQAGIRPGDRLLALDGRDIGTFEDIARFATLRPGERVVARIERDGTARTLPLTIGVDTERDRFGGVHRVGRLGIRGGAAQAVPVGILEAPGVAMRRTGEIVSDMIAGIVQVVTGRRPITDMGGPVKIAQISGQMASLGLVAFVTLAALISINLGFINLLPVPMLDGGHLMFYAIEGVTRRPVGERAIEWAYRGGLAVLLALMVTLTVNDLGSVGLWRGLAGLIG